MEYQEFVDERIQALNSLLAEPIRIMNATLERAINGDVSGEELDRLLSVVNAQYETIQLSLDLFSEQIIAPSYASGAAISADTLREYGVLRYQNTRDIKTISILIRDMKKDFSQAIGMGQKSVATYFKFSKQGRLTESEISEAVARGLIDGGTGWEAKREMRKAVKQRGTQIFDQASLDKYIKKKVLQGYEKKLLDGKVMQLINKNGKVMNFRVDSYADLVSRTRIGDAQVAGAVDMSHANGIELFKVTKHNTKSAICLPHEGQILTSNKKDKRYAYLYGYGAQGESNKPLYHPNCQHRLMPYVDVSDIPTKPLRKF